MNKFVATAKLAEMLVKHAGVLKALAGAAKAKPLAGALSAEHVAGAEHAVTPHTPVSTAGNIAQTTTDAMNAAHHNTAMGEGVLHTAQALPGATRFLGSHFPVVDRAVASVAGPAQAAASAVAQHPAARAVMQTGAKAMSALSSLPGASMVAKVPHMVAHAGPVVATANLMNNAFRPDVARATQEDQNAQRAGFTDPNVPMLQRAGRAGLWGLKGVSGFDTADKFVAARMNQLDNERLDKSQVATEAHDDWQLRNEERLRDAQRDPSALAGDPATAVSRPQFNASNGLHSWDQDARRAAIDAVHQPTAPRVFTPHERTAPSTPAVVDPARIAMQSAKSSKSRSHLLVLELLEKSAAIPLLGGIKALGGETAAALRNRELWKALSSDVRGDYFFRAANRSDATASKILHSNRDVGRIADDYWTSRGSRMPATTMDNKDPVFESLAFARPAAKNSLLPKLTPGGMSVERFEADPWWTKKYKGAIQKSEDMRTAANELWGTASRYPSLASLGSAGARVGVLVGGATTLAGAVSDNARDFLSNIITKLRGWHEDIKHRALPRL